MKTPGWSRADDERLCAVDRAIQEWCETVDWAWGQAMRTMGVNDALADLAKAKNELTAQNPIGARQYLDRAETCYKIHNCSNQFSIFRAARHGQARRKDDAKGGSEAAEVKKEKAEAWQGKIRPKVLRMLSAGKKDTNIGALLAGDAGRAAETVRKYVAKVREDLEIK